MRKLVRQYLGLYGWFMQGILNGAIMWGPEALACYKQNVVNHSNDSTEDDVVSQ